MKSVLKSYGESWRNISKYRYVIMCLFLLNFVLTYIISSPYTMYFKNQMEYSNILSLFDGYDINAIAEFVHNYGAALEPLQIFMLLSVLGYFLLGIFTNACTLYAVISNNKEIRLKSFWTGGLNYFWKVLRLSIYYVIAFIILSVVTWKVLLYSGINVLEVGEDRDIVRRMLLGISVISLGMMFINIIRQYAKIYIAIDKKPLITTAILKAARFTYKKVPAVMFLYLINFGFILLAFSFYFTCKSAVPPSAWLILFILSQVLIVAKIIYRILHLDSSYRLWKELEHSKEDIV